MACTTVGPDFVRIVAEEMSSGIDRALRCWLGRIELEINDRSLTATDRLSAIQKIVEEYKGLTDNCAADHPH